MFNAAGANGQSFEFTSPPECPGCRTTVKIDGSSALTLCSAGHIAHKPCCRSNVTDMKQPHFNGMRNHMGHETVRMCPCGARVIAEDSYLGKGASFIYMGQAKAA